MTTIRISEKTLVAAMQSEQTRAALKERADKLAEEANERIAAHHLQASISREDGTRPKGRPYSRVSIEATNQKNPLPPFVRYRILDGTL